MEKPIRGLYGKYPATLNISRISREALTCISSFNFFSYFQYHLCEERLRD